MIYMPGSFYQSISHIKHDTWSSELKDDVSWWDLFIFAICYCAHNFWGTLKCTYFLPDTHRISIHL